MCAYLSFSVTALISAGDNIRQISATTRNFIITSRYLKCQRKNINFVTALISGIIIF